MGGCVERRLATLGLLISAGCSCLFVAIAVGVLTGGPLARFDRWVADVLHAHASQTPALTEAVRVVGAPGSLEALALVSVAVAAALLAQRRCPAMVAWLVAVLLGREALNVLLKDLFVRPQPRSERPLVVEPPTASRAGRR